MVSMLTTLPIWYPSFISVIVSLASTLCIMIFKTIIYGAKAIDWCRFSRSHADTITQLDCFAPMFPRARLVVGVLVKDGL